MDLFGEAHIDTRSLYEQAVSHSPLRIPEAARERVARCRQVLEARISEPDAVFYGINTGFGDLHSVRISPENLEQLQYNLIRSHACGAGEEVPPLVNDLIQLLKIRNLALGYSGVHPSTLTQMTALYNAGVRPVICQQGSLGASGDLAPLAHLSLALIGEGEADYQGQRQDAGVILSKMGLQPLRLGSKEGLALLNGTQFSTAYGVWAVEQGRRLIDWAEAIAALSLDSFLCQPAPLDPGLHRLRNQPGQIESAAALRRWLEGSALQYTPRQGVQDPYAFRCTPQVHGASRDAWTYAQHVIEREINAVTDNPTIFPETGDILSGGNFHAQPVALALDFLAMAMAEIGAISERRTFQLLSGKRGLPPFLIVAPGLHSGLMIAQYTAAGIVSQNKQLCSPASVDSIVSSNGQEDHVSMAANAATKLYRVIDNVRTVLAIEWLTATQALHFRRPTESSLPLEKLVADYRRGTPVIEVDRILSRDIAASRQFLEEVTV